jgi:hypothetical protein
MIITDSRHADGLGGSRSAGTRDVCRRIRARARDTIVPSKAQACWFLQASTCTIVTRFTWCARSLIVEMSSFAGTSSRTWLRFYRTLRTKLAEGASSWFGSALRATEKSRRARQAGRLTWLEVVFASRAHRRCGGASWRKGTIWSEILRWSRRTAVTVVTLSAQTSRSSITVSFTVRPRSA